MELADRGRMGRCRARPWASTAWDRSRPRSWGKPHSLAKHSWAGKAGRSGPGLRPHPQQPPCTWASGGPLDAPAPRGQACIAIRFVPIGLARCGGAIGCGISSCADVCSAGAARYELGTRSARAAGFGSGPPNNGRFQPLHQAVFLRPPLRFCVNGMRPWPRSGLRIGSRGLRAAFSRIGLG